MGVEFRALHYLSSSTTSVRVIPAAYWVAAFLCSSGGRIQSTALFKQFSHQAVGIILKPAGPTLKPAGPTLKPAEITLKPAGPTPKAD